MDVRADPTRQMVRLRGRSYVAFVFSPVVPIVDWLGEIDATLARSPGYFVGKPIVLDLAAVDLSGSAIAHLLGSLNERNIRVLGIEGVAEERLAANMPPLLTGGRACVITRNEPAKAPEPKPKPNSLLLESPVRSGQSIIFADGDVTVLELRRVRRRDRRRRIDPHLRDAARRAMAGVNGNSTRGSTARRSRAELLAIDGYYQTAEEIDVSLRNRPAQAWLEGDTMKITPLN